ncbi:30S ribosomal protein S5 [Candidatus Kaiserbacteria bacterium CG10_big_fil_rev_8_21_14_0_10_51_14]|uniref:Small ribosomal subunit protein uS5 n=1 Tax=Candidatus Kaiserbacteria bacterium CG10_big_fil_rev_8_21_14_0_10_51_14 TaxID=1974610 RepID=A0A2H0UBR1_9BACT|nr:MAG: 30S ribosomal protein S5 [Candidatus Kaiserbacteria bacterium CG10_big_fil_rev_8_21_14_0_10_51_14]
MAEDQTDVKAEEVVADVPAVAVEGAVPKAAFAGGRGNRDRRGGGRGGRPNRPRGGDERRSEFAQKLIGIRRVARVMAGGRRFNFSAALVIGDKKGRVGVGLGKAADTAQAIDKATRAAKRSMISLNLTKNRSLSRNVEAKYCASRVEIRPSPGRGLVAGSSVRTVLELAGVSDVTAKLLSRSKNPVNNARAAIEALKAVAFSSAGGGSSSGGK